MEPRLHHRALAPLLHSIQPMPLKTFGDKPFVGQFSLKNELEVIDQSGLLICKSLQNVVLLRQIVLAVFGCALTAGAWYLIQNPTYPKRQLFWILFLSAFALICWLAFIRNLFGTSRFEFNYTTGELFLFRHSTREPWKRIPKQDIERFLVETQLYRSETTRVKNSVLLFYNSIGQRRALCASPDHALVLALGTKLSQLTQRPLDS